ncbi:MAG: nucleotidyltransferase family protein [Patescibacteria group bacterium]
MNELELQKRLLDCLEQNLSLQTVLDRAEKLKMPNWYLGAGGITQTVWNILHGFAPEYGIKDYDLVYFDASDISYEAEDKIIQAGQALFADCPIFVEIRNQARVHLWYEAHFGKKIAPHESVERAICSWPTTITAIGVRKIDEQFTIFSPFGLADLFNLIVRPNRELVSKEIYLNKVERWKKTWPKLTVLSWDEE